MEVRCDKCQARYRVDDARIGPQGLTMRCGKCQNTFKVTRPDAIPAAPAQAPAPASRPAPAAVKPAAKPAEPGPNATMVFGQSPVAASKPAMPSASSRPAAPAAKPPAARPAAAAPADEGAGRTMMFQTGNLKTSTPAVAKPVAPRPASEGSATMVFGQSPAAARAAPPAKPAGNPAQPGSGSTMVFGQAPLAKPAATAMPKASAAAKPASGDDSAGSTMMFGASPGLAKPPAAPARPAPAPEPEPEPEAAPPEEAAAEPQNEDAAAHEEAPPADEAATDSGVEAEGAEESAGAQAPADQGAFDKAPPRALLIGVAAGIGALVLALVFVLAWKKFGSRPPPPAAIETLTAAQAEADKDTLASIAGAEGKAKDALDVAGARSKFPQGSATLAFIEIQWADALNDQANSFAAKAPDDPKVADVQKQAEAKLKAAFDAISPALKAVSDSPDLKLALADYYRASHKTSNMNKALKSAQALKADDARVSLVQGMALAQEEDGAEKAIPKLKAALLANPNSARVHFRLALAYQAMKDDANASSELKQVLKLSPQHERAKLLLEATASADGK